MAKTICIGAIKRPGDGKPMYYHVPDLDCIQMRDAQKMLDRFDELVLYRGTYSKYPQIYIASGIVSTRAWQNDKVDYCLGIFPRTEAWRVFRAHVRML